MAYVFQHQFQGTIHLSLQNIFGNINVMAVEEKNTDTLLIGLAETQKEKLQTSAKG